MLTGLKRAETGVVMACPILFELFADGVVDSQERWCGKSRRAAQTSPCATGAGNELERGWTLAGDCEGVF